MALNSEPALMRRAAQAWEIQNFVATMWREAEKPWGADASQFWTENGVFAIEGLVFAQGRENIQKMSSHRELIGPRVSRHLMTNYSFEDADADGRVRGKAVMTHFGGTGEPPLVLQKPLGIYDVSIVVVRKPDGAILLEEWRMNPAFLAENHPAFGMPRELSHPGEQQ